MIRRWTHTARIGAEGVAMGKGMGRIEPLSSPARFTALLVCAVSLASFVLQYVLLVRVAVDTVGVRDPCDCPAT